jgi:hypothetical protein
VLQNIIGTGLVIIGAIILSSGKPAAGDWRKLDIVYPLLGALLLVYRRRFEKPA